MYRAYRDHNVNRPKFIWILNSWRPHFASCWIFCSGLHSEYCFFFIFEHSRAPKRFWKIFHGGPGKVVDFLSVKVGTLYYWDWTIATRCWKDFHFQSLRRVKIWTHPRDSSVTCDIYVTSASRRICASCTGCQLAQELSCDWWCFVARRICPTNRHVRSADAASYVKPRVPTKCRPAAWNQLTINCCRCRLLSENSEQKILFYRVFAARCYA